MRPIKIGIDLDTFEGVEDDGQVTPAMRWHELRAVDPARRGLWVSTPSGFPIISSGGRRERTRSRFEEALTIITTLLREGQIDFTGSYYQARDCELRPRGPRSGGPPILVAGGMPAGPRMLRLGAERADLWNDWLVWGRSWPDAVPPLRQRMDEACAAVGT